MKCPYIRKSLIQIYSQSNDLASLETGVECGHGYIMKESYTMQDCLQKECGVYYNGRCHYAASVLKSD